MTSGDYRNLCPNSGHALPRGHATVRSAKGATSARCALCDRIVGIHPDPASGRALLYSMHARAVATRDATPGQP